MRRSAPPNPEDVLVIFATRDADINSLPAMQPHGCAIRRSSSTRADIRNCMRAELGCRAVLLDQPLRAFHITLCLEFLRGLEERICASLQLVDLIQWTPLWTV
jgi:hypothetical protein